MKRGLILLLFVLLALPVSAEEITVGVKPAPPFIIMQDGEISGFSFDLVNEVVKRTDPAMEIIFKTDPDLVSHLKSVEDGSVDLGIAATSITAEREKIMDFSQPFYRASLGILSRKDPEKGIMDFFLRKEFFYALLGVLTYIFIIGNFIWIIERGSGQFSKKYFDGVGEGIWWTVVTMSTVGYGDVVPKRPLGKFFGIVAIFSGIGIFSIGIATISSSITLQELTPSISGINDLAGQKVAVIKGSVASSYVSELSVFKIEVSNIKEGVELVRNRKAIAFIHDVPLIQYYLKENYVTDLQIAPETFFPSDYGIAFPQGSILREDINRALLEIIEGNDPFYANLEKKWFGIS
jgi:polar amino acid transport system substrate-binding protein